MARSDLVGGGGGGGAGGSASTDASVAHASASVAAAYVSAASPVKRNITSPFALLSTSTALSSANASSCPGATCGAIVSEVSCAAASREGASARTNSGWSSEKV